MPYPANAVCYANPNPTFQPAMRLIESITNANPAVVTTTFEHQYLDGTIIRLDIPPADGMQQANGLFGSIVVIDDVSFAIDIDTTKFEPFVIPAVIQDGTFVCALAVPIGGPAVSVNQAIKVATVNALNPFR